MNLNNEKYKQQIIPLIIYLFLSFVLVSLSMVRFFDPIYLITDALTKNLRSSLYVTGVDLANTFTYIGNSNTLIQDNKKLKQELYSLHSIQAQNYLLTNENKALSEQLGTMVKSSNVTPVMAEIISTTTTSDYITIGVGGNEGVANNNIVVYKNILLGIVTDVRPESSVVQLVSSKDSSVPVSVSGSQVQGILTGSVESGLIINDILPDETVDQNAMVLTSSLGGGLYPSGLLVGYISSIQPVTSQPFKIAQVKPAVDISTIDYLFVLKNKS